MLLHKGTCCAEVTEVNERLCVNTCTNLQCMLTAYGVECPMTSACKVDHCVSRVLPASTAKCALQVTQQQSVIPPCAIAELQLLLAEHSTRYRGLQRLKPRTWHPELQLRKLLWSKLNRLQLKQCNSKRKQARQHRWQIDTPWMLLIRQTLLIG